MEFDIGDMVFVRVTPYCHVMRFGWIGKLALRLVELFEILEHIGKVT